MRGQDSSDSGSHLIFDHLSGGVIAVDRSATLPYLGSTAARTLGLQPDTALDKPLPTLPGGADPAALLLTCSWSENARELAHREGADAPPRQEPHGKGRGPGPPRGKAKVPVEPQRMVEAVQPPAAEPEPGGPSA